MSLVISHIVSEFYFINKIHFPFRTYAVPFTDALLSLIRHLQLRGALTPEVGVEIPELLLAAIRLLKGEIDLNKHTFLLTPNKQIQKKRPPKKRSNDANRNFRRGNERSC